jgi:hypothetical protein
MNQPPLHKRGDLSPCGTLRFFSYQSYVSKKTGDRCERWIPAHNFEQYKRDVIQRNLQSNASGDFIRSQRSKAKLS